MARAKLIAVLVGPEGVGVVGVVDQLVLVVMNLSAFSLPLSAVTILSRSYREGPSAFRHTYLSFLTVLGGLTLAGTAGAVALVAASSRLLAESLLHYRPLLILGLLSVPALAAITFGASVLAAARRARDAAVVTAVSGTALFLSAAVGIPAGGLEGLYGISLVVGVLVAAATFAHLRRELHLPFVEGKISLAAEVTRHPDLVFYCVSYFFVASAYPLAWLIARYSVLDQHGAAEAGRLQAMIALAVGFGTVLRPVNTQILVPMVSGAGEPEKKFHDTIGVQRRLAVLLAVLAMPLVLFPRWLLTLLYTRDFTSASPYLYLFVVAEVIVILAGTYQALLLGMADMRAWALLYFVGYACLTAMSWRLGRPYGIPGVAVAAIVSSLLMFGLTWWRLWSYHGFRLPGRLVGLMVVALTAIYGGGLACARFDDGSLEALLVKIAGLLLFAPGLFFCLDAADRQWTYHFLRRFTPIRR